MDTYQREIGRLFLQPGQDASSPIELLGPDGLVKTLVLSVKARQFEVLANLLWGVVEERHYPMPAIAVTPDEGFQVWVALAEAVPFEKACALVESLRGEFLGELPEADCVLRPSRDNPDLNQVNLPPSTFVGGRWSAFIDPTLIAMFKEESWLDVPPRNDQQGDLLSRLETLTTEAIGEVQGHSLGTQGMSVKLAPASAYEFLVNVMNDPAQEMSHRIAAATALLKHP